ncbi:MAG: hypothetical protein ACRC20_09075 [Segniliparus sp.]|uniref:hypothetical protein n=1 Tax=Segniliparus sp. TaxID=2804064 RepID=UPI003F2A7019
MDTADYLIAARGRGGEVAFLSPDGKILCGVPTEQFPTVFCVSTSGQFPEALKLPTLTAPAPEDENADDEGQAPKTVAKTATQIELGYHPATPAGPQQGAPTAIVSPANWQQEKWSNFKADQAKVLPAGKSISASGFTCTATNASEVRCMAEGVQCWTDTSQNPVWNRVCTQGQNNIGFVVSQARYELFNVVSATAVRNRDSGSS